MTDPRGTLELCEDWLAQNAELEVLSARWRIWETNLVLERDWANLSKEERACLPCAREFLALEAEMRALSSRCEEALPLIANLRTTTPAALAAKLKVALREVCPGENPEVHALLASAVRDANDLQWER